LVKDISSPHFQTFTTTTAGERQQPHALFRYSSHHKWYTVAKYCHTRELATPHLFKITRHAL